MKRLLNDRPEIKNSKILYGYDPKLLKEYGNVLLWINKKMIENKVNYLEKKRASESVTTSAPTEIL